MPTTPYSWGKNKESYDTYKGNWHIYMEISQGNQHVLIKISDN